MKKVFSLKGKEYHFYHVNTRAQHLHYFAKFESDNWISSERMNDYADLSATDKYIGAAAVISTSNKNTIYTRIYNPDTDTWSSGNYEQNIPLALLYNTAATDKDFYLVGKRYGANAKAILYKWDNTTKLWNAEIEEIPNSEKWSIIETQRGITGEFILRVSTDLGMYLYRYKDKQFTQVYFLAHTGTDDTYLPYLLHINDKYYLAADKLYSLGNDNKLTHYFTPVTALPEHRTAYAQVYKDKIFLFVGIFFWYNRPPSVANIFIVDTGNGKVHRLPTRESETEVSYTGYYGKIRFEGGYNVGGWNFRINNENKVEAVVSMGEHHDLAQAIRLVFSETLK